MSVSVSVIVTMTVLTVCKGASEAFHAVNFSPCFLFHEGKRLSRISEQCIFTMNLMLHDIHYQIS
jgi:hypothetical protein